MNYRKTLLAASIITSLCVSAAAFAADGTPANTPAAATATTSVQDTSAQPGTNAPANTEQAKEASAKKVTNLVGVTVTGIRASLQASMNTKRNADAILDAITAEDIGKFPATNVAEALEQIPGVTLDRSLPATQRVSIDGIDPSLNLSYLDGHPVAQALWLYGDSPNRGFNYSLLPPEILGKLEVYKSPEARLPEGSLGGTVIMHTRQPLDVPSNTVSGSYGLNYNDMTKNSQPDASVFYSWHNDAKTFGADISAQHYEQTTSRQGLEVFGYTPVSSIAGSNPAVAAEVASGAIKGTDEIPQETNAASFKQTEKRNSVLINLQYRPNENFDSTLSLMYMKDSLDNLNESMYPFQLGNPAGITSLKEGPNGIITSGTQVGTPCFSTTSCTSTADTYADTQARSSTVTTKGIDWRGVYKGDGWSLGGQLGVSNSKNDLTQAFKEIYYGGGFDWNLNKGFNFTDPSTANNPSYWADNNYGGNIGYKPYRSRDSYAQLDFTKDFDGFLNQILVGARYDSHWESQSLLILTGPANQTLNEIGYGGLTHLSGAHAIGLSGSTISHVQTAGFDSIYNAVLNSGNALQANDPVDTWNNTFNVQQQNRSAYLQANFGNDAVHGNLGVRYVSTKTTAFGYDQPSSCYASAAATGSYACDDPAGFGYVGQSSTHNNLLPAFNIAWNVTPDVILRGAASETVAYAPYNELAPYFEANDTVLTGTAGNPNIKPYRSINFDMSAEWYFNDESVVAVSGFYKNVLNYVVNAAQIQTRQNGSWLTFGDTPIAQGYVADGQCTATGVCQYNVSTPVDGGRATVKGAAISFQQAFGDSGFGIRANYTYSDSHTDSNGPLPYNSKNSFNLAPYFEKGPYSASVSYNWRSSYLAGGYVAGAPDTYTGSFKELDASVGYKFNTNFSVSLDALNLLNSTYYQYFGTRTQLADEYATGREFMLTGHFKF